MSNDDIDIRHLVAAIRATAIDQLVANYADTFEGTELGKFKDAGMLALATHWKNASLVERPILKAFIRLGAQNSVSSLLAVLDNVTSSYEGQPELRVTTISGGSVSGDLLDTFWAQEEEEGHVNVKVRS